MMQIGYQASHEQFPPGELLQYVQEAEKAGFQAVLSSDHIHPWSQNQGNSGFAWSWLGATMQATGLSFGVVTVPGYRYHPAILAQAVATLENMFPGRFFLTLGSGEALNEHVVGKGWPDKPLRNDVLRESAEVMRRLWRGEKVTHFGNVNIDQAELYVPLPRVPDIIGAALSEETASWLGSWADGLITTARPLDELQKILQAFKSGGGVGKRLILKADLSYDPDYEQALQGAYEQWRFTLLSPEEAEELKTTELFDAFGDQISMETVKKAVKVSDDLHELGDWIAELAALGFEKIILHNVNRKQNQFIEAFGEQVLPELGSIVR
jgi:probable non-F420 flavinoid oxidoreductase